MQNEKATISKEDALAIGLALNGIATIVDDKTFEKIKPRLETIQDTVMKYVPEDKK